MSSQGTTDALEHKKQRCSLIRLNATCKNSGTFEQKEKST